MNWLTKLFMPAEPAKAKGWTITKETDGNGNVLFWLRYETTARYAGFMPANFPQAFQTLEEARTALNAKIIVSRERVQ